MTNIYLDTNIIFDLYGRNPSRIDEVTGHNTYASLLSLHILAYATKAKIPDAKLNSLVKKLNLVSITKNILSRALIGPTSDLEDNMQLHSAIKAGCQYFLTEDQTLLRMGIFGEIQIIPHL